MTDAGGFLHACSVRQCGRISSSRPEERRTDSFRHVSTCCAGKPDLSVRNACPISAYARCMPFPDMPPSYRGKWNISHSFGRKAADRYLHSGKERRYWEDRWLKGFGLSRDSLTQAMENRRGHPFGRFIYPEYEEITKRRLLSSEAGYLVCALSTLMWTPFSPSCSKCTKANPCRRRTEARYPELYRIRCEAWWKEEVKP